MSRSEELQRWFEGLSRAEKEEVVGFIYGKLAFRQGQYYGPVRNLVPKGIYCGPAPQPVPQSVCPQCGKPY